MREEEKGKIWLRKRERKKEKVMLKWGESGWGRGDERKSEVGRLGERG